MLWEHPTEQALNHAWEWTKYHAEQRLTMVRFAIIMIGGVAAGIGHFWQDHAYFPCVLLSLFGILGAVAALRIDKRTYDMILAGENALKVMQRDLATTVGTSLMNIVFKTDIATKKRHQWLPTYSNNFRFLYFAVMTLFLIVLLISATRCFVPK
jgi:hypothetical protein